MFSNHLWRALGPRVVDRAQGTVAVTCNDDQSGAVTTEQILTSLRSASRFALAFFASGEVADDRGELQSLCKEAHIYMGQ